MTAAAHLWAVGYHDMAGADEARDKITQLAWGPGQAGRYLILEDIAVVVRHPDGTFTFDRERFPGFANIAAFTAVGFLAGLVLAAPLAGAAIGAVVGGVGTAASAAAIGIDARFVREVEGMMRPGTSALFVLDDVGSLDVTLHTIGGLGGTVLRTNVDRKRAKLIQSTLAVSADTEVGHEAPVAQGASAINSTNN
jgi:uncharacterized membrane protein